MFLRNGHNTFSGTVNDSADRFTAKPSSFTSSGGDFDLGGIFFAWLFFFAVFAGAFVLALYNFFLVFTGAGDGLNVFFGMIGIFVLYLHVSARS